MVAHRLKYQFCQRSICSQKCYALSNLKIHFIKTLWATRRHVSGPTYRQANQLVILAAGISPHQVDVNITCDPVASTALS